MHPIVKIIIGAALMVGSAWTIYKYTLMEFWIILQGIIPPLVFILGLFIVWLELDELRIERELRAEERKVAKAKRRRR
ncbi:MAG: hypothetical protein QMD12_00275 [Candidatus Aenigmarchaeota archaeon]|nr:hypothetical protein [Candidatus Aenigmarchaeota archaeon]